ncbi:MAG: TonB-dependent receptor, partial [Caulobacteraceae bacterium]|nr:TonB-dependent receptor [Caulobacteraceae bacterium]
GSDALSGVVNLKLKRNFTGVQLDGQYGLSEYGDGKSTDLSVSMGTGFGEGKGHALFALTYTDRGELYQRHRSFFSNEPGVVSRSAYFAPDGDNLPTQAAMNAIFAKYGVAAGAAQASSRLYINPDGTLYTQTGGLNGRPFPGVNYVMYNGVAAELLPPDSNSFSQPLTRYNAFASSEYEISNHIKVYGQVNFTTYDANNYSAGDYAVTRYGIRVPVTNPFLSPDVRQLLASRPNPTAPFLFSGVTNFLGVEVDQNHYNVWQLLAGVSGDIPGTDWTWDVYASRGETSWRQTFVNGISYSAIGRLFNAPDGGASLCQGGLNAFPLTPTGVSDACKRFVLRNYRNETDLEQQVVEANMQGGMFSLPAGQVRFAVGAGFRRNTFDFAPDAGLYPDPVTGLPEAMLTNNQRETLPVVGSTSTKELYGEVLVPVLKDMPLINQLNLGLAYRYSDYDTVGGVSTYKGDVDWAVIPQIRLRAGYQRAIRAPSVGELFAPPSTVVGSIGSPLQGAGDGCDVRSAYRKGPNAAQVRALCVAQGVPAAIIDIYQWPVTTIQTQIQGNSQLKQEKSDSYTAGVVLRPEFSSPLLSSMSLSFDYYKIKISDAMGVINGSAIYQACFNGTGLNPTFNPNSVDCSRISRASDGSPRLTVTPLVNLASYETSGIDMQFDWAITPADLGMKLDGRLTANLIVSYVDRFAIKNTANAPFLDFAGTIGNAQIDATSISHPKWKMLGTVSYDTERFGFGGRFRYTGSMSNSINVGTTSTVPGVASAFYLDLFGKWNLNESFQLRGGITNVADKSPPLWTGFGATDRALYDVAGRSYYVGATAKF